MILGQLRVGARQAKNAPLGMSVMGKIRRMMVKASKTRPPPHVPCPSSSSACDDPDRRKGKIWFVEIGACG